MAGCETVAGVSRRRLLGAFYTPDHIADVLVQWALAEGDGPILDPSYGGCAFLEAALRLLRERGHRRPQSRIFGVDIDQGCIEAVRRTEGLTVANCPTKDFLETSPQDLDGSPFTAVVGNPPYVRHHWISGRQRTSARAVVADSTAALPATAGLWAYFVLHSLNFLASGGRLAMLVPEAILQADYAAPLRERLADQFARTSMIYLRDRVFDGTDEPVVVLACADFGSRGRVDERIVEFADDLPSELAVVSSEHRPPRSTAIRGRPVQPRAARLLRGVQGHEAVRCFSEIATVKVGLVTGANSHFIRSVPDLDALKVPQQARHRIVARTRWLTGLEFGSGDHQALVDAGARALLVRPAASEDALAKGWIAEGLAQGFDQRYKCSLRDQWFRIDLLPAPDAFATCARLGPPRIVLNRGHFQCSNTVHSVEWEAELPVEPEAVAVGFLTSAVALWAELHARRYGGGVLKMEPGVVKRTPVPIVSGAEDAFADSDRLLRKGSEQQARELADDRVLRKGLGMTLDEIRCLQQAQTELLMWRRPSRNGKRHA